MDLCMLLLDPKKVRHCALIKLSFILVGIAIIVIVVHSSKKNKEHFGASPFN